MWKTQNAMLIKWRFTAEMLPPESNPERRQVKVNSRHRLHHAAELPALGQAGNMVFCAYISPAGACGSTFLFRACHSHRVQVAYVVTTWQG
jgi:hypothetical protein